MTSLVQGGCCLGCDGDCVFQILHTRVASQLKSKTIPFLLVCILHVIVNQFGSCHVGGQNLYIYINKDGKPSTKSTWHVDANVNISMENQDHQNSSNEMENVMLKGHPMPQIS